MRRRGVPGGCLEHQLPGANLFLFVAGGAFAGGAEAAQHASGLSSAARAVQRARVGREPVDKPLIDLPGMIPAVSFEDEWTQYPALLRMVNQSVVYSQVKDGDVVPLGGCEDFDDVATLVEEPSN